MNLLQDAKRQAFIRLSLISLVMILFLSGAFYFKNIIIKIIFAIIGGALAALLIRILIAYKRKKLYFDGKVISVTKPKRKILGKYSIVIKKGKVSKKFYAYTDPKFTLGKDYVVVYEEKSLIIMDSQEAKFQMMGQGAIGKNPKYRM